MKNVISSEATGLEVYTQQQETWLCFLATTGNVNHAPPI